jgi:hypothetical protein
LLVVFRNLRIPKNSWARDPLDMGLNEKNNPFAETKSDETLFFNKRNETKRNYIFFGTETKNRNEINIFQKRNGTKRKKNVF